MIETQVIDDRIISLYEGQKRARSLINAALQKRNGHVYVDSLDAPTVSCLTVGRFTCMGGDPDSAALCNAIRSHPPAWIAPASVEWEHRLAQLLNHRVIYRNRILFDSEGLDPAHIARFRSTDTAIEPISRQIAETIANPDGALWGYASVEAFLDDHVGFTVNLNGKSICHAASYAIYNGGIELNVWTHPEHRGRKLATHVCAHLILHCLDRGLIPHWDAANDISAGMAVKFGYRRIDTYRMLRALGPDEEPS